MPIDPNNEPKLMPFHEWKDLKRAQEALEGRAHDKDWYCIRYGGYCETMRADHKKRFT